MDWLLESEWCLVGQERGRCDAVFVGWLVACC